MTPTNEDVNILEHLFKCLITGVSHKDALSLAVVMTYMMNKIRDEQIAEELNIYGAELRKLAKELLTAKG